MPSRRQFLSRTFLTAGALGTMPAFPVRLSDDKALPPAIAQLQSRKALALPITRDERAARLEKARQLMGTNQLDAIVLMEGTSLDYFAGIRWWGGERMFLAVVPVKGPAFFVCPAFEEGRAHEQIANSPLADSADVRVWQEDESPYLLAAQGLKDRGLSTAKIGLEETIRYVFSDGLSKAAQGAHFVSATPVTAGCRMIKSPHELDLMHLANQVTLAAYEAVYHSLREGMTQYDVGTLVESAHDQLGFPGDALVEVGEFSAFPHGSTQPQTIREGVPVLIDGGCRVEGYESDITRMMALGKPTDKMNKVFEIVHRAQSAALAAARPGVECGSVDAAARKVITDAGYGPDYKFFTHRLGHGIGMDGHEWPYLVRNNATRIQTNMTFSDEPGIYIRGEFGIRLEDDMHITENGAELFTPQSPSLEHPFAKA
jgi:Xaa-Pro dipeptidase